MVDETASRKMAEGTDLNDLCALLVKAEKEYEDARDRLVAARSDEIQAQNNERSRQKARDLVADAIAIKIGRVPK